MPKILQKKFCSAYFCLHYAVFSPFGKHFAWIFALFFAIMEEKQKICKKHKRVPKKEETMKLSNLRPLGKYSRMVLHIELPVSLGAALLFLFSYLQKRIDAPVYAAKEYAPLVAYLLFPLIITAFSVLLIERLETENE